MCELTKKSKLLILPDGPIGIQHGTYKYSKGERVYIDNLAKNYKQVGIATFVLESGDEFYETILHSKFNEKNITILPLPKSKLKKPSILQKLIQFVFVFFKLIREIRKYDVLYLFLPSYPSACSFLICLLYNKKYFIYGADDWVTASKCMFLWDKKKYFIFYKIFFLFNSVFEKLIIKNAIFGVAAGGQLVSKYRSFGCNSFFTVPRMNLKFTDKYVRKDTCNEENITIVSVGNLINDKAQHILIDSFSLLYEKMNNINLIIIGTGPLKRKLELHIQRLDLSHQIQLYGYVEKQNELFDVLKKSDIFALSSVSEGFPRVLYEAMCMSLPIVSTDVGGIGYLLKNKENALLIPSENVQMLTDALYEVINNKTLRKKIIDNCSLTFDNIFKNQDINQISNIHSNYLN